jgi:glycosyltransferase involved in cell wall biosynthesis
MKFSIVTPSFNMERFIEKTIESIVSQEGDFEIEYILADGASTDTTVSIFENYRTQIENGTFQIRCKGITMKSLSEKDNGTFDAINKGFALATGDLLTWADADNTFLPGAFEILRKSFEAKPDMQWIVAIGDTMDDNWRTTGRGVCQLYRQDWLRLGVYGREAYMVVQNGCVWRTSLSEKVGPIPTTYKVAGDYWFWMHMAQYAAPIPLEAHISSFMRREGQLHLDGRYQKEQRAIRPHRPLRAWIPRLFFWPYYHFPLFMRPMFEALYPVLFWSYPRNYLVVEDGKVIEKKMPTFVTRT